MVDRSTSLVSVTVVERYALNGPETSDEKLMNISTVSNATEKRI